MNNNNFSKFEELASNIPDVIWECDLDFNLIYITSSCYKIFGYTQTEFMKFNLSDRIPEKKLHFIKNIMKEMIFKLENSIPIEMPFIFENMSKRKDGSLVNVEISAAFKLKDNLTPIGIIGVTRDITKRKKIENDLRNSYEKYKDIIEFQPITICELDLNGIITYVNKKGLEMFGYSELKENFNITNLIHPDNIEKAMNAISSVIKEGKKTFHNEYKMLKKDRSVMNVIVNSSPIYNENNDIIGIRTVLTNITKRVEIENELKYSKKYSDLLLNTTPSGIFTVDNNLIITSWNKKAELITGFSKEEIIGKECMFFNDSTCKNNCKLFKKSFLKPIENIMCNFTHKNGKNIIISKNADILKDENGNIIGGIESFINITEKIESEKKQKELEKQLQHSQKLEAIGQLAGGIAHDFNNQLGIIQGYSEMLNNIFNENSKEKKYLSTILKACEYSSNLTEQMLTFARKGKYESVTVNIHKIIYEIIKIFERSFDKKIKMKSFLNANDHFIIGDNSLIENMFLNIGINSRDAMPNGGELTFSTKNINHNEIGIPNLKKENYLHIAISDTGNGIDDKIKNKIFEPFFTTKDTSKGSGMGLSSVYGTVKTHNGIINFNSSINMGTTFNIFFPIHKEIKNNITKKNEIIAGTGNIMVIDDDKNVLDLLEIQLEQLGYKPFIFSEGSIAIDFFNNNSNNIDLIILDVILKDISVNEIFYKLKNINKNVKIIIISGFNLNNNVKELIKNNTDKFIQKPYSINELSEKLYKILNF